MKLLVINRLAVATVSMAVVFWWIMAASVPARAQDAATTGSIMGTVVSPDGVPIAGATITLEGATRSTTTSDAKGAFGFAAVFPGTYSVSFVKAGFVTTQHEGVVVSAGTGASVAAVLAQSSFSSLREISHVTVNRSGGTRLNTSAAAVADISGQTFLDQGQQQVTKVLNETPGVVTTFSGGNGAALATVQVPQIRGALPYETESLVDGHPVSVGAAGFFTPIYLNPALLQNVELIKGPGALSTDINYAIGGSVNYRTLEPTRTFHGAIDLGVDGYGGQQSSYRITGSTNSHIVDYAFGLAIDGTPGPLRNYPVAGSQVALVHGFPPYFINGQALAGSPVGLAPGHTPQYAGLPGMAYFAQPLYVCCSTLNTQFLSRAELGKLRFNLSQQTALTVSYLGGQGASNLDGTEASSLSPLPPSFNFSSFSPPPGYAGSVPAGAPIPFDLLANSPQFESVQQGLFQGELRSAIGKATVLARYYSGANTDYAYNYASPTNVSFTEKAYGGVPLCPVSTAFNPVNGMCAGAGGSSVAPTMTFFNGQPTTFTSGNGQALELIQDHLRGYSLEFDLPVANNVYSVALDSSHHDSSSYTNNPLAGVVGFQLAPGSSQQFTTILARAQLALTPRLTATISNYAIQYASHYTGDGGATFSNATKSFDAPRLAFAWRPNVDVAWRFALGSSIAPPYISLLSAPAAVPVPNSVPATFFTLNSNNGQIAPETAFGYNFGFDKRFKRNVLLSADVYETNLHDLFLPSTFQRGTFASPASGGVAVPLFVTQTQNLGFARYEGVELTVQRAPRVGVGFKLQGGLQRAYPYNLPAGFYNTAAGPFTTNLAILPNVNFQPSGLGYNGLGFGRVPYGTGYAELNLRTRAGVYYNVGLTYYGSNNSYNTPAFGVLSSTLRVPLSKSLSLQVSADNLTGAYSQAYSSDFAGNPVPLANRQNGAKAGFLGLTSAGNVGPTTVRAGFHYELGE